MSTKALLRARIRSDIFREDLDVQIGEAIDDAIRYYGRQRFYFNESLSAAFATVAGQAWYSGAAVAALIRLDAAYLVGPGGQVSDLRIEDPERLGYLIDAATAGGEPYALTYYGRQIGLYPVPSAVRTVRLVGHMRVAAPATDDEADNPWMTEAFELIRCKAKSFLFAHHLQDGQAAALYKTMEQEELDALRSETTRRVMSGEFARTDF